MRLPLDNGPKLAVGQPNSSLKKNFLAQLRPKTFKVYISRYAVIFFYFYSMIGHNKQKKLMQVKFSKKTLFWVIAFWSLGKYCLPFLILLIERKRCCIYIMCCCFFRKKYILGKCPSSAQFILENEDILYNFGSAQ